MKSRILSTAIYLHLIGGIFIVIMRNLHPSRSNFDLIFGAVFIFITWPVCYFATKKAIEKYDESFLSVFKPIFSSLTLFTITGGATILIIKYFQNDLTLEYFLRGFLFTVPSTLALALLITFTLMNIFKYPKSK